ncbi:MAG: hypothetical protein SPC78_00405 [Candidatus Faecousia sp.]|nr:hypothetical protein [Clostridiales bacterium]MDY4598087.1 hypothetical protein [Candidatus Faecousia sp.]
MGTIKENSDIQNDDLWELTAHSGPISKEELGISDCNSIDGLKTLQEGVSAWSFELNQGKDNK